MVFLVLSLVGTLLVHGWFLFNSLPHSNFASDSTRLCGPFADKTTPESSVADGIISDVAV